MSWTDELSKTELRNLVKSYSNEAAFAALLLEKPVMSGDFESARECYYRSRSARMEYAESLLEE